MILTERDRQDLTFAMKTSLLEQCKENPAYFGENLKDVVAFIKEGATYEQLLNLTFNENRNNQYLPAEVMECLAAMVLVNEFDKMCTPIFESLSPEIDNLFSVVTEEYTGADRESISQKAGKKLSSAKTTGKIMGSNAINRVRKLSTDMRKQVSDLSAKHPDITKYSKWVALGVGATVAATFIYKKFIAQNAKECKGKIGSDYTDCVAKLKKNANVAAVKALRTAMASCAQATNPEKCKASYQKEINKRK